MVFHILNGDALAEKFSRETLPGELIIFRECLMEGPLDGDDPEAFRQTRARFIGGAYGETDAGYEVKVTAEIRKISRIPDGAEVNLWFEHDLFCQVNMWYILSLLEEIADKLLVNRVMPQAGNEEDVWLGFGPADGEALTANYQRRVRLSRSDLQLARNLWDACRRHELERMQRLAAPRPAHFPYLEEVVQAHADRFPAAGRKARPVAALEDILRTGVTDFPTVFRTFARREGIYGFGDTQVRSLLKQMSL